MSNATSHNVILTYVHRAGGHTDAFAGAMEVFGRLGRTLLTWQTRATERNHLASLDNRLLADMGMTHADASIEAAKPFWRP
jgi:uncharacterized protein YjiS (DUF1127 family)